MKTNCKPNRPPVPITLESAPGFQPRPFRRISGATKSSVIEATALFGTATAIQKIRTKQAVAETARDKAEAANKSKSDFLINMSHEIRTPMSAIIGLADILLTTKLDHKQRQCIDVLRVSADALMVMINGLLDLSKIESGTVDLIHAPFSMAMLLDQVVGIMSVKAQEKGIDLVVHHEGEPREIFIGDSGRIRQIVLNLVGNAIKFTDAGQVTISFASKKKGKGKRQIFISVADTGIGIAEEKIATIFGRFVQADTTIEGKYGGTGLGLSISKALAENMGGDIAVSSVAGKGSTFVLHLQMPVTEECDEPGCVDKRLLDESAVADGTIEAISCWAQVHSFDKRQINPVESA